MSSNDGLDGFLPVVATWFRTTFGAPTPPQQFGWPAIAEGRNTLIFAPTGSGKTLAAFLACLDHLWRTPRRAPGARILYISPLKALNHDVYRNLQMPLEGIVETARAAETELAPLSIAVRSGDTSSADRQKLVRKPPDILITTPESLHLMLTSRARETLRSLSHVIIDEIHALCPNKRGVFLALLLERLEAINPDGFVRIGLSATQRPLDEVARYLGGCRIIRGPGTKTRLVPRPVTIIDTGHRKELDLQILVPFERPGPVAPGTTWPAIERRLLELIRAHRSTIIFANNRRVVERLTAHLNEHEDGPKTTATALVRSHHGSLSQEERRNTEEALKGGELQAVVATASLELGIDMGAVDLVCQVESPGSVARGLQRVGRAGHVVGRVSKGRLIAKTASDLLESAALCRAMVGGAVESLRVPNGCLDVLAQQVVACVAMDRWDVPALFDLVRGAYPYGNLAPSAFDSVLRMVAGRFPTETFRDLRARVSWDRVHNRLHALPGSARLAVTSGGTIPDTGQYPVYLGNEGPRLGELDEEFVFERRVGETFVLGTATWRIEAIETHRVVVARAEGQAAMMPFWRGEDSARTPELGEAVGALSRELVERLDDPGLVAWLQADCHLEPAAAESLRDHVARQVRVVGAAPDDRTVIIESFRDPAGEMGVAVLTPFGGKLHQALKLALQGRLRERLGISLSCLHADDGILIRLPQNDEPPLDVFDGLTSELAERLIREELGDSALFGLRFRQNAGRALLMPRPDPSKRTPLWLQRLRAKDLLQVVRQLPDFPIVVETYRECLNDDLDLPRLRLFLDRVASGTIRVVARRGEIASPFATDLIFRFTSQFLYQWDEPRHAERQPGRAAVDEGLLDPLLDAASHAQWLDPNAIGQVESRLREIGRPPRTVDEMAETLRRLGDLAAGDLSGPMLGFLVELQAQGRAAEIELARTLEPTRWISAEESPLYESAFAHEPDEAAQETIVRRFLGTHALVGLDDLLARYPLGPAAATDLLERWEEQGRLVRLEPAGDSGEPLWAERRNLEEVRRLSMALRRRESVAVAPEVFADFVARRQHVHPATHWEGQAAVGLVLEQLTGFAAPADLWETDLLPRRVRDFRAAWLDELLSAGGWFWRAEGETKGEPRVGFAPRDFAGAWPSAPDEVPSLTDAEAQVLAELERRGASFATDLARNLGLEPSRTRLALDRLLRLGLATNDRFDPLRPGGSAITEALTRAAAGQRTSLQRSRPSLRRTASSRPEGRWWRLEPVDLDLETGQLAWAAVLLERYGVLARETAALDPWCPPWRDLAPWLARAELRGELRRGYFVEGLSGVQYATLEVAEELARMAGDRESAAEYVLISSLDPANLYGSGAPLDIDLLEGGTARLPRNPTNFLVLRDGRPVLIIEAAGKRLTGLASASETDLRGALALVPTLAGPARRVLKVESYNTRPALESAAAPWLAEIGFVRDYPGMTYYAGW
ncbi:DEAD/DEAH box helicase [Singulisphaera sp. GP187]|uniref:DEAD/DEAH box helicase n=1 Tax=Singulisphaera sp. GP187 TaxID=1882752 RepID=UPI0009417140|nr:DEAD/DEAH box helicase [Singulisphaera sp. GP187]